jgi:hypothetical protein
VLEVSFRYSPTPNLLTVRFLEPSAGGSASVLLGLASAGVAHQQAAVVLDQRFAELVLRLLVDVLGVVRNDALGDGGPDRVNLCRDTTPLHPDSDVNVAELVLAHDEDRLEYLEAQGFWLHILNRLPIDLDQAAPLLGKGDRRGSLFPVNDGYAIQQTGNTLEGACHAATPREIDVTKPLKSTRMDKIDLVAQTRSRKPLIGGV